MVLTTILLILASYAILTACVPLNKSDVFQLSVIHMNDFHARFEEISSSSSDCKIGSESCIGGFARIYTAINQLVNTRPNPIVLNGGDNFQGTLWYNIYKWNVTQHFLNLLPIDAYTLGNHEFDHGIKGLVPFLNAIKGPVVASNIDDTLEPDIQGLYNKSIILERGGKKIGIIGVTSKNTHHLSNSGKLKFLPESDSVNNEAERLLAEEKVDTIIVLSHCGYESDKIIARNAAPKIGLIVGAHSHTFLYTGHPLPGPEKPSGPYPTVINHDDGRKILVVQASALSKYLGNLTVQYNNAGNVVSWSGAPIYVNKSVAQDEEVKRQLQVWKEGLKTEGSRILGYTKVLLKNGNCRYSECNLGNFITDAMVFNYLPTEEENAWAYAAIAVTNSGGIKSSIRPGNITYSDLILTVPFGNTYDVGEIQGRFLKEALEYSAGNESHWGNFNMDLLQVSGINVVYNVSKPIGSRIESLKVRCRTCQVPLYEDLDEDKFYRIVFNSFLGSGGDGHTVLDHNIVNRNTGEIDSEILERHIKQKSPIIQELQERIRVVR